MIKVLVVTHEGEYKYFKVEGHALYAKKGKDIICAAVSALSTTAVNAIEELTGHAPIVRARDGYLKCEIPENFDVENRNISDIIIKTFLVGISGIANQYPKNIQLIIEEVESDAKI